MRQRQTDSERRTLPRIRGVLLGALVGVLGIGTLAIADEPPTRAEYVAQLEGICKPRALATERTMRGVRADVQAERIPAWRRRSSPGRPRFFGETLRDMAAVERPTADATKLAQWFIYLNHQEAYLRLITAQLHAGHPIPAQRLTARFIHNGNLANNTVLAFGFDYCSFKFSRYG